MNITGPKGKLCRRVSEILPFSEIGNQEKKYKPISTAKDKNKKLSEYAKQLTAKQKLRLIYGVLEKQFRNYYKKAARQNGSTGENLVMFLESRLDNVVYRMGFATTRAEARQLVSHCAIMVNDSVVNIASFSVSAGDVISIRNKAREQGRIKAAIAISEQRVPCEWLNVNSETFKGTFSSLPSMDDVAMNYNVNLVVELYSK